MSNVKRFTYSTRTLLIVTAVIAMFFSVFGLRLIRTVKDRRVAIEIKRLGGRFDYGNSVVVRDDPWYSRFASLAVYEDFSRITHVSVNGTNVLDDDLARMGSLSHLQGIDISSTDITDVGLEHLASAPSLRYVNAHKTRITERFVNDLRKRRPNLVLDWELSNNATEPSDAPKPPKGAF